MRLTGEDYRALAHHAFLALNERKEEINQMNVFPVPDGDTGLNMSLTMSTLEKVPHGLALGECASLVAKQMLFAARGNSGAILSLFFRGVAKALKEKESGNAKTFAEALCLGAAEAYGAVEAPKEGTILSVMRASAEAAKKASMEDESLSLASLLSVAVLAAEESVKKTPEELPVLKEAGVLDAGGFGFLVALYGMLAYAKGEALGAYSDSFRAPTADFSDFRAENIVFPYCTECIVEKGEGYDEKNSKDAICSFLFSVGDSAVFAEDESVFKLHVHTSVPGEVLSCALRYGALLSVKIENMRRQHGNLVEDGTAKTKKRKTKKHGFLCVCSGEGVRTLFYNLGADAVVDGGATMNPDAQSIADAAEKIDAETVFVLPNSKNVILVAERAREILGDDRLLLVPAETVAGGLSAMLAAQADTEEGTEEVAKKMREACSAVTAMAISRAVRDSRAGRFDVQSGQYVGLVENMIACTHESRAACARALARGMTGASFVTLLYGESVTEDEAQSTADDIRACVENACEVTVINGGQPIYDYIISVE